MKTTTDTSTVDVAPTTEFLGRAMGSVLHILATGDPRITEPIVEWAVERVGQLERRWSRFRATSEVSQLNAAAGRAVTVSADTIELVSRACEARRLSGGSFDPTLLQVITASGYDRTFVAISGPAGLPALDIGRIGLGEIWVDKAASTVKLGATTGFDPGGIGKGLAADLVATAMVEQGAHGALVNIGGDVRCVGLGPAAGSWVIGIGDTEADVATRVIELHEGAVASSTSRRRRWKRYTPGGTAEVHHLIDPATGRCTERAADLVTVIAATCADAEWLATAIAAQGSLPDDPTVLGHATVMMTTCDGASVIAGNPDRYLR